MKYIYILASLPLLLLTLSCSAENNTNNSATVVKLINTFLSKQVTLKKNASPSFKLGDFNGDGLEDIAVLFTPISKPIESAQIKVSTPWIYPSTIQSKKYHKSLAVFQSAGGDWLSDKTRIFIMLDTSGVLETPSFKLLVSNKSDKDYKEHKNMLPVKTNNDLIILPTEAGIDTYIYWDKGTYNLFEPEEMP
ncbi:MAG: hypothetical protein QM484_03640 [Woeseiaceae bacterium]